MNKILKENLIKNIILILILIPAYPSIQNSLNQPGVISDISLAGNLLVAVSILSVIACFGAFAFTYEKTEVKNISSRFLGHITTGLLLLLIGLSLEMTSVLASFMIANFPIFNISLVILYLAVILYDFWDLNRVNV